MAQDQFQPKLGRIKDARRQRALRFSAQVFREAARHGRGSLRQHGHIKPGTQHRGTGAGVRAAAGLIAPGRRRVIVKARYTRMAGGGLEAARVHLRYIQRDGVTPEGERGRLYDRDHDGVDAGAFLERSENDPHQFRFIVSADDSARLHELKPFVRDLMAQMEYDLDTKLDWVAVDHFNTGHPHTHIVIRGRDDHGKDLVMARDYIGHGVRARAQALITIELGPETDIERVQRLHNEVTQERLTQLDRSLIGRVKDGIVMVSVSEERDPAQRTFRTGRLKQLERLGLAEQKQPGIWSLDAKLESKLRQLGERADKFRMMQRALKEAGIERSVAAMALFERGPRKEALIGRIVGVGMVDEITDRTWVIIDAVDGRVHYAELGRLAPEQAPTRGAIVALGSGVLSERPTTVPKLDLVTDIELKHHIAYHGPTWLDQAAIAKWRPEPNTPGFAAELRSAIAQRGRWLRARSGSTPRLT
jgi:type IV secretory pathway VirD2 relaxase